MKDSMQVSIKREVDTLDVAHSILLEGALNVFAWIRRFISNSKIRHVKGPFSTIEAQEQINFMIKRVQRYIEELVNSRTINRDQEVMNVENAYKEFIQLIYH